MTVISVENLAKSYRIKHELERQPYVALRDVFAEKFKRFFGRSRHRFTSHNATEDFWALKDVSFEIKQGEVLGVIGRNGAGKSTLLKILSRITEPTEGRVRIKGRVSSLLEVGTGFHPELTGRENIFLNGAILGMSRAEIKRKFDEIVTFAEVEKFLDTPVKHYSSGMYVRLAFAVAAHLEPEILIVDEVLAVGDAEFQKKCMGKMQDVAKRQNRAVIFVSHNMAALRSLCSTAILLQKGKITDIGPTSPVIESYGRSYANANELKWERPHHNPTKQPIFFSSIDVKLRGTQPNLLLSVGVEVVCQEVNFPKTFIAIDLCDAVGTALLQAVPHSEPFLELQRGTYLLDIQVHLPALIPGRYTLSLWLGTHFSSTVEYVENAVAFAVDDSPVANRTFPHSPEHGFLVPKSQCEYEPLPVESAIAMNTLL